MRWSHLEQEFGPVTGSLLLYQPSGSDTKSIQKLKKKKINKIRVYYLINKKVILQFKSFKAFDNPL